MMKKQIVILCAAVAASFIGSERGVAQAARSHANHGAASSVAQPAVIAGATTSAAPQQAADTTVTIRSFSSDLEFVPAELAFKQGTRVRIRYINEGTFPHNIVILKTEKDIDEVGTAAFNAGSTGYVPMELTSKMVAHSALAAPGKTIEFTFVMPAPGTYPFVCLYPGHYNMMIGTLRSLR